MPAIRLPTPHDLNPAPRFQAALGWLGNAEGRRQRRTSVSSDGRRAHIEVRGAHRPERHQLVRDVKTELTRLAGVDWAEVDAVVGRAVIFFDPEAVNVGDFVSTIEAVEEIHGASDERFPHDRPDHPADREPIQRHSFAIAADIVGFGFAAGVQALRVVPIPAEIPGLVSIADSQPRVRHLLENRIGRPATDVMLVTANALSQALGQGPLGLIVDIAHRVGIVGELQARHSVWQRREPEIAHERPSLRHRALAGEPRPVAIPAGPIERYSDRAAIGSLGALAVTLGVTRNPRRASDLLLVGIPKAATLGREAYAAQLDRGLAAHGVITMDTAALRRLDRVDILVIEASVAMSDGWSIDEVVPFSEQADTVECTLRARSLLDLKDPMRARSRGVWTLAPLAEHRELPRGATTRGRILGAGGRGVLGLWRGDELNAFVALLEEPAPLAHELVKVGQAAGLEVMLAGGTDAFARRLNITTRLVARRLAQELRTLQEHGRVPILVAGGDPAALRAADIGLGVEVPGAGVPWGADLLIGPGLVNAWRVVDAVHSARDVSRRSALFALGGASAGGVWAFMGPARTAARRALLPINASALASIASGGVTGLAAANRPVPRPGPRHPWHALDPEETLELLESSRDGLGQRERAQRSKVSTARVVGAPTGIVRAALDELANPLTPVLALGAALSAAVGSTTDAALVSGVVVANALVGAVQRMQTERSLLTLEETGDSPARVRVAGKVREVRADSLVVGDVMELAAGDTIRADCRLLDGTALEVDESAITGESLPVAKTVPARPGAPVAERTSMLYEGSAIAAGSAVALVVAVGRDTEAGRAAAAAAEPPPSGVERRLGALTRLTVPVTLASGAVVTGLGFLYRRPARDAVGAGVALTVAAVPEGLPTLATITQVAAARRLASRNALVRNPRALEALGRVDQVCFDKTGTLTQGRISLARVSDGATEERLDALSAHGRFVLAAAVRSTPVVEGDDTLPHATDQAILVGAGALGIDDVNGGAWHRRDEIPFESRRGYHAVLASDDVGTAWITMKGAPEVVIPLSDTWRRATGTARLDAAGRHALEDHVDALGRRGLRVLAVAEARAHDRTALGDGADISGLELLGFVCLADLVRPAAASAVRDLRAAGVRVAMITGDHPSTAEAIAAELGLLNGGRILTGADLDQLDDDELQRLVPEVAVFARVAPLHKVRIVEAYQRAGRTVAMTGDGANDAAAIRLADAGIAMGGRGTAAARASADVIVVDDRIETIVDAVAEGRAMWDSVRDAVAILVGGNLGELGFILVGSALTGRSPLNPRQLLLVNLLTDMAPALAIALREPPDRSTEKLLHAGPDASLGGALARQIAIRAGATATGATTAWIIGRLTGTPTRARTIALAALVGTQLGQTVAVGGRSPIVIGATVLSAGALVIVIQTPGVSQFFGCRPLGPVGWATAIGASTGVTAASIALPWALARLGRHIPAPHDVTNILLERAHFPRPEMNGAAV